jgi:hypothetical protein
MLSVEPGLPAQAVPMVVSLAATGQLVASLSKNITLRRIFNVSDYFVPSSLRVIIS